MKKRLLSLLLVLVMVVGMLPMSVFAAQSDVAYVTIAVEGDLKLVRYPVKLSDVNESGGYDIDDALSLAHNEETKMEGGYTSYNDPSYGLGVSMLWGDDSTWFGYTVNGTLVGNLEAAVKAGDEIYAWVYTNQNINSSNPDILAEFDKTTANVAAGEAVEVTLDGTSVANGAGVVVHKLKDNHRLSDEVETAAVFGDDGKASVTINEAGTFVITAAAKPGSAKALVPPYCMVTVGESLASSDVIYTVSSAEAQPGDTVELTVSVDHDLTAALNYWDFAAALPEDWEITGWKKPSEDSFLEIFSSGSAVSFQVGGGVQTYLPTGDLVKMTVKIPANAAPGEYTISLNHFDYENRSQNKVFDYKTTCNAGTVTVKAASEAPALEDVQLVAPEGLTTEDGINYYGAETMGKYTFGYTTVPAGVEVDAQSWTFKDGGNNSTNGSGATINASVWSAGKGTLTLSVTAGEKTVNKTWYIHTGAAPTPEAPEVPENNVFVTVDLTEYEGTVDSNTFIFHDGLDDVDYDHGLIPGESKTYQFHSDDINTYQLYLCLPYNDALLGWSLNDTEYLIEFDGESVFDEREDDVLVMLNFEEADDENGEPYYYLAFNCEFGGITGNIANSGYWTLKPIMAEPAEPEVPFTVAVNGEEMTEMTLGEVNDPDYGTKPLYTVTIPAGTTEVTITWKDGNNYSLSYYDANASYLGYESARKNSWTIAMDKNGDGAYDMLQIYGPNGYAVPYWITFASEEPEVAEYTITVETSEHGKVTASAEKAEENVEITLTVEADEGYELDALTVTDASGASVTVTDNKFIMPASDVRVTATFKAVVKPYITITVGEVTGAPGETVNVPVTIDTDFTGRAYQPAVRVAAAEGAPLTLGTATMGKDVGTDDWYASSASAGYLQLMHTGGWMGSGAVLPEGEFMVIPVTIAEDAEAGDYALDISSVGYEWYYYDNVTADSFVETKVSGKITVESAKPTVTFALDTVSGKPGETVTVAVHVSSDQTIMVRNIGFYPEFDHAVLSYPNGTNSGISASNKDATVGSALTWTKTITVNNSGLKYNSKNLKYFLVSKGSNADSPEYYAPLPQGEALRISFKIAANTQPGSYKVSLPEAGNDKRTFLKDVNSKLIDCNYQTVDGYVIVMGTLTAPILTTATAETTTITVAAPAACTEDPNAAVEYSVSADGGQTWSAWQTSNVFADLLSNTEYQIRARYNSELAHYGASGESNIITATTSAGQYVTITAGSITEAYAGETVMVPVQLETNITAGAYQPTFRFEADAGLTVGTPVAGKDLDTNVWSIQRASDGYIQFFHYQGWMQKGGQLPQGEIILLPVTIAEDAQPGTYSVTVGSVGYEWYYYDNVTGEITNKINGTITVLEGPRKTVLDAPVLERVDAGAVTVAVTAPAASKQDPDAVLEYAISQNGITYSEWQTALRFEDLASDCTYYVIARYKAVDTVWYKDSEPSAPFEVKTLPQSATFVPTAEITIGSTVGQHGDELIIPITVEHNMTDAEFASVLLSFLVENDLTEENIQLLDGGDRNRYLGSALADDPFANSNGYFIMVGNYTALSHSYYLSYWNQGDTSATYNLPSGELFLLYIKIDENAAPGEYTIGLETKDSPKTPTFNCTDPLYGTLTDTVEVTVNKGTVTVKEPLTAPVLTDYVASDDTVTVAAPQTVEGASVEYAISEDGETYGEWQSANAFAGLKEETTYYVIARYVVKDGHTNADSYAGEPLEVKTVNPTAAYTVASVTAKAGETVELAVTLTHEIVKQATSFQIIPTAAEGLTLQSAKAGTDLGEGWKVMLNDGVVTVYRSDAAAVPSGEVAVLIYAVSEEAEDGDYTVTLSENFAEDGNAFIAEDDSVLRVNGTVTAGKVTVQNIVLGDLNSDAVVDMKDLVSLRRYLAGWADYNAETLNLSTIDLNEDGVVNMLDAIILSRHLAGWPDYETLPFAK